MDEVAEHREKTRPVAFDYSEFVTVTSNPSGLTVFQDDRMIGRTPVTIAVDIGRVTGEQFGSQKRVRKVLVHERYREHTHVERIGGVKFGETTTYEYAGDGLKWNLGDRKLGQAAWTSWMRLNVPDNWTLFQVVDEAGRRHDHIVEVVGDDAVLIDAYAQSGGVGMGPAPARAVGHRLIHWDPLMPNDGPSPD